jgi:hypothetical protein
MKIAVIHTRAFEGTDITVSVQAEGGEGLRSVNVGFDGDTLDDEQFDPGTDSWSRSFSGVGQAGPGDDHSLIVTAVGESGKPHTSITRWTDAM